MSDTSRRGSQALLIVGGTIVSIITFSFIFYHEWLDRQPPPIDRTATRWANSIAEQDAKSIREHDPDYETPKFDDPNHKGPWGRHPNSYHPSHPSSPEARRAAKP